MQMPKRPTAITESPPKDAASSLTLGRREYGSRFVVHSFVLSTALQRAALTSSLQLRYEQAKRVDGLQSDGWILLKCFRSRVMAGSPL